MKNNLIIFYNPRVRPTVNKFTGVWSYGENFPGKLPLPPIFKVVVLIIA
jgi:hypothetical protein